MTAGTETRQEAVAAQNEAACPVVHAIDEVGTPWRLNVVYALADGEKRFNELKRATNARSKTLSDALEELTDAGIVNRRMEEAGPVAVFYSLTPKGEELSDVLAELGAWAERWNGAVPGTPQPLAGTADSDAPDRQP